MDDVRKNGTRTGLAAKFVHIVWIEYREKQITYLSRRKLIFLLNIKSTKRTFV